MTAAHRLAWRLRLAGPSLLWLSPTGAWVLLLQIIFTVAADTHFRGSQQLSCFELGCLALGPEGPSPGALKNAGLSESSGQEEAQPSESLPGGSMVAGRVELVPGVFKERGPGRGMRSGQGGGWVLAETGHLQPVVLWSLRASAPALVLCWGSLPQALLSEGKVWGEAVGLLVAAFSVPDCMASWDAGMFMSWHLCPLVLAAKHSREAAQLRESLGPCTTALGG